MFGKHEKTGAIAENNAAYVGKHENLVDSIAEIMAELCSALDITEEFVAEVTAPARKLAEKLTERIRKSIVRKWAVPEFRPVRWKYSGAFDAGIFDMPTLGVC